MRRADALEPGQLIVASDLSDFAARLLDWMELARRDLPWRHDRIPYTVWISEVMLQQTQVATVVPYFQRWIERFPNVHALADAPLDDVLKLWEGLGYYARARNLQRAAQLMVERHAGQVPDDLAALLALPGIGRYSAGAILSMAFRRPEPILDGNIRRLLCRLEDISEDPREPSVEERLWRLASRLVQAAPEGRAGEFNEALIELGALVCTPELPACHSCPVQPYCRAFQRGTTALRPTKQRRPATPYHDVVAAVIEDGDGRVLIIRRRPEGLLGGLWGFPGGIVALDEDFSDAVRRTVQEQTGMSVAARGVVRTVKHTYTHFHITLHGFTAEIEEGEARPLTCAEVRWIAAEDLEAYAFAVTDRKVARALAQRS